MTLLAEATADRYDLLTRRTFLVLDTEFCSDADGNHLISLACVPVVRGRRVRANGELYVVMNPGVPIDDTTRAVHGFADADVARKRTFAHYAPRILDFLASHAAEDPVLVTQTGTDVHLLRTELKRLHPDAQPDSTDGADEEAPQDPAPEVEEDPALQLPLMPLMDTSTLHRAVGLPALAGHSSVALSALCDLLGVTNAGAHDARHDARATADVLIALLAHTSAQVDGRYAYSDLEALLEVHARGTTHDPAIGQAFTRRKSFVEPKLRADHGAAHARSDGLMLPGTTPTADDISAWVATATACVQQRCRHLPAVAALTAAEHAATVWDPLWDLATTTTGPGQPATALGALMRLLDPHRTPSTDAADDADELDDVAADAPRVPNTTAGALTHLQAMPWWRRNQAAVADTTPCETSGSHACPDCRSGNGCPRDRFYEPIAAIATFGKTGRLDKANIKNRLFGREGGSRTPKRAYYDWTDARCVAHMVWLVAVWTQERGQGTTAGKYLAQARRDGYHLHDPRLAHLVCENLANTAGLDAAEAEVTRALEHRTTDPAWKELRTWLTWRQHEAAGTERAARPRTITVPRLARPEGRSNANPYLP